MSPAQTLQLTFLVDLVCSDCDKLRIGDCPMHGGLTWIKEPTAVSEKEGLTKARSTIPSNMDLKISSIPGKMCFPVAFLVLGFLAKSIKLITKYSNCMALQ